jgi:hypothetical protein
MLKKAKSQWEALCSQSLLFSLWAVQLAQLPQGHQKTIPVNLKLLLPQKGILKLFHQSLPDKSKI